MSEKKQSLVPGIILIVLGVFFLLRQFHFIYISWHQAYPVIMLALALMLFLKGGRHSEQPSIFPGTVLFLLGIFFFLRNYDLFAFDYYFFDVGDYWPVFPLAFGVAFLAQFLANPDDKGVLIPGLILLLVGAVFSLRTFGIFYHVNFADLWPLILIAAGIALILGSIKKKT